MSTTTTYEVFEHQQEDLFFHLINSLPLSCQILVYARSRENVQSVNSKLIHLGIESDSLHGKKKDTLKKQAIHRFQYGKLSCLVTTEAAARELELRAEVIINYDLPELTVDYIKRESLTRSEDSHYITLVTPVQKNGFMKLQAAIDNAAKPQKAEGFSYDTKPIKTRGRCKSQNKSSGLRSKPLQNKKPKLRPKHKR